MKRSLSAAVTVAVALAACHADRAVSPGPRAPGGAARAVSLAPTTTKVNFEGLTLASGASVEGLGRVAPNLAIHEITAGGALLVRTGSGPSAYGAPSGESSIANGCLGNPGGWTATRTSVGGSALASFPEDETRSENYDFTFGARAVSRFAIRMVDYGDFNPKLAAKHRVVVTAYDAAGAVVAGSALVASVRRVTFVIPGPATVKTTFPGCPGAAVHASPVSW